MMNTKTCMLIAMESSGDLLGSKVMRAMKQYASHNGLKLSCTGIAGPQMRQEGVTAWKNMEDFQVMGLIDVTKKLPSLCSLLIQLKRFIERNPPDLLILLDSPSFGLKVASRVKKSNLPTKIVQIVAPSVWAWGKKQRLKKVHDSIDLLIPLFSFEQPLFESSVQTMWCGHPLFDDQFFIKRNPKSASPLLALFPGSRPGEVKRNLPLQLASIALLQKELPRLKIGVVLSESLPKNVKEWIHTACQQASIANISFVTSHERYALMDSAWAALSKCGTVVLELFLKGVPSVVCYSISPLEQFWAKHILHVQTQFFSLPNIIAKKEIVQERIYPTPNAQDLADALKPLLKGNGPISLDEQTLLEVQKQVVRPHADETIAHLLLSS